MASDGKFKHAVARNPTEVDAVEIETSFSCSGSYVRNIHPDLGRAYLFAILPRL